MIASPPHEALPWPHRVPGKSEKAGATVDEGGSDAQIIGA